MCRFIECSVCVQCKCICVSTFAIFVVWIRRAAAAYIFFVPFINLIHGCIVLSQLLRYRLALFVIILRSASTYSFLPRSLSFSLFLFLYFLRSSRSIKWEKRKEKTSLSPISNSYTLMQLLLLFLGFCLLFLLNLWLLLSSSNACFACVYTCESVDLCVYASSQLFYLSLLQIIYIIATAIAKIFACEHRPLVIFVIRFLFTTPNSEWDILCAFQCRILNGEQFQSIKPSFNFSSVFVCNILLNLASVTIK